MIASVLRHFRRLHESTRRAATRHAARSVAPMRGAVFVEALIVISVLLVGVLGVAFFRVLYLEKLQVQRLARVGALAHAMAACRGSAASSVAADVGNRAQANQTAPRDAPRAPTLESDAQMARRAMDHVGGAFMSPVTSLTLSGSAQADSPIPLRSNVASQSFVGCGDELTDDQLSGVADFLMKQFQ